ncbi:MAG: hypothetical protein M9885_12900 [Burkholderiaceae bacterium]|nr:hypothetical protein [Burkholderiaceae bacterium]
MPDTEARRRPHPSKSARRSRLLLPAALVALASAGCATTDEVRYGNVVAVPGAYDTSTYAVRQPLSLGEIIAALRAGRSPHELADEVDEKGLLAPATSADIDLLLQSGADAELIDAVREASATEQAASPPPFGVAPPITVAPPVIVTPPPLYPSYGWYPYAPYAPFSFGLWYYDAPRYRALRYRPAPPPHHERWRPDSRPPRPGWQSPRLSPAPEGAGESVRPGGSSRVPSGGSPRVAPGGSRGAVPGAVRGGRTLD